MKPKKNILEKIWGTTDFMEKFPYSVFIFVLWLIYKASQYENPWTFDSFFIFVAILMAMYCFFFYIKLLLSTPPDRRLKLHKRIGISMKLCLRVDFILTFLAMALLFWINYVQREPMINQLFFALSYAAQVLFIHLLLATLYNMAFTYQLGMKWVLSVSTVVLFCALITLLHPFAGRIVYFSPFIGLFYMYLSNLTSFIWGMVSFVILFGVVLILIPKKRYLNTPLARVAVAGMRYLIKIDWIFATIGLLICVGLSIFDKGVLNKVIYAAMAVLLAYIIIRRYVQYRRKKEKKTIKPLKVKKLSKK